MQPPLTQCAREALAEAQVQARALNQEFVGTEHLMLALMHADSCQASRTLHSQHVDRDSVRAALLRVLPHPEQPPIISGDLPLSPKAKRALNNSIVMAQSLREQAVSTRILLMALVSEDGTAFTTALKSSGADVDTLLKALAERASEPEP